MTKYEGEQMIKLKYIISEQWNNWLKVQQSKGFEYGLGCFSLIFQGIIYIMFKYLLDDLNGSFLYFLPFYINLIWIILLLKETIRYIILQKMKKVECRTLSYYLIRNLIKIIILLLITILPFIFSDYFKGLVDNICDPYMLLFY